MWYYVYPPTEQVSDLPFFLHSIGLHELQPPVMKPAGHSYDQFFYHATGSGTLVVNGISRTLPAGCGFFLPAGTPHEYYPSGDVWDIRWFVPRGTGLTKLYHTLGIQDNLYLLRDISKLDSLMNQMHRELIRDPVNGNLLASSYVSLFITEFARQAGLLPETAPTAAVSSDIYSEHFQVLRDYIQYHYSQPISLSELTELIHVSPQHLCRIFKHCTGMRPTEYIAQVRIDAACELLRDSSHSICDIALWCGFENNNYFWKTFKKLTAMTPGEYRLMQT